MQNTDLSRSSWGFFRKIFEFFFPSSSHKIFGKLFVSGAGCLEFTFKDQPNNIYVYFNDECHIIPCSPCDPGQEDMLRWHIIEHKHHVTLIIEWRVNAMRTISWNVCS